MGKALRAANGDMPAALTSLKGKLPAAALKKVALAHTLAVWSDDHVSLVKALSGQAAITNLRDVALHFNAKKLAALVDSKTVPENTVGATIDEKKKNFAIALQNKLFTAEPTAVLQRMVQEAEVPIADVHQRKGVASFLSNQPEFNIRTTSVYTALKHPDGFNGIADEHRAGVDFCEIKYSTQKDPAKPPGTSIQVTGILTDAEKTLAKTFSNNAGWAPALDRVGKQAKQFFSDNVFGIFSNSADAIVNLLAGDINVPPDPNNSAEPMRTPHWENAFDCIYGP